MSLTRSIVWLYAACAGLVFAYGSGIDAALTQAYGPNPIRHVAASPWVWGAGPQTGSVGWAPLALGMLGAGLGWLGARRGWWSRCSEWLGRPSAAAAVGIVVAAMAVFWFWRVEASRGDAFKYLIMLRDERWFVTSQPLSTAAFSLSDGALAPAGWPPAAAAAVVSVLAGGLWVAAVLRLLRSTAPPAAALLVAGAVLAGATLVFFGYVETMALPLALATWYMVAAEAALAGRRAWPAAILFGLAVAAHGQLLLLGPSLLVVAAAVFRRAGPLRGIGVLALAAAPVVLMAAVVLLNQDRVYDTLVGDILGGGDRRMFVPWDASSVLTERYTMLSGWHLWEIANLLLRAGPWLPLLTIGGLAGWWRLRRQALAGFWALIVMGSLAFVVLWNADFGMDVDWDLYAPPIMLALLVAARLWPTTLSLRPVDLGVVAGLGLGATVVGLMTFAPAAAWDPWNVDALLTGRPMYGRFGDVAELVEVSVAGFEARAGETWRVTTTWRLRRPTTVQYTSAVHVIGVGAEGLRLVAQHDGRPVAPIDWPNPRFTDEWIVGELVPDAHAVPIPPDTAPGQYEVWAVLYDLTTGQRLAAGENDHVVIGTLQVTPP